MNDVLHTMQNSMERCSGEMRTAVEAMLGRLDSLDITEDQRQGTRALLINLYTSIVQGMIALGSISFLFEQSDAKINETIRRADDMARSLLKEMEEKVECVAKQSGKFMVN